MPDVVFIGTAAWLVLLDLTDSLAAKAMAVLIDLRMSRARFVTTEFVLIELADALSRPISRSAVVEYIDQLRNLPDLEVVPAESAWLAEGWRLFSTRPDKAWRLTDCISFAVMTRKAIRDAFTSDPHFVQAGFAKLM
jgi:predicted nucleic acid-binding protein